MERTGPVSTSRKTIVVFSGDFDKVLAAFVIANGAAAMDDEVTMFFTFWGLTALRRPGRVAARGRTPLQRGFARMMPRGPRRLPLSRMNLGGAGPRLMRRAMRHAHVMSLPQLIAEAREQGVKMVACTMSMDVLGLTKDDLVDGVEFAGVASYLGDADQAGVNLFI
jgi:peroxiredoxin family protein